MERQINELLPKSQNVEQRIEEVRSIALPSVLECLQDGFAEGRGKELLPETTLTRGFPKDAMDLRFMKITYQHRMHSEISTFSRREFYENSALNDANTIADRNRDYPFEYRANKNVPHGLTYQALTAAEKMIKKSKQSNKFSNTL